MTPIGIMDTRVPLYVAVHIISIPYPPVQHSGTVSHIFILALHIYMRVHVSIYIFRLTRNMWLKNVIPTETQR